MTRNNKSNGIIAVELNHWRVDAVGKCNLIAMPAVKDISLVQHDWFPPIVPMLGDARTERRKFFFA
ncbi:MAG: hypothetical protein OXQ84_14955 [bacterium]|nr:hypothetical protein [bacterium]